MNPARDFVHPVRHAASGPLTAVRLARGLGAFSYRMLGSPTVDTRKGCRQQGAPARSRAPKASPLRCASCATRKGRIGSEEGRPKPQGRTTVAPAPLRGDRSSRLAAPAVRRETETGKGPFATASSADPLRRLQAAAMDVGRVCPMRRQEEGGHCVLPPQEEHSRCRKRERTGEEAHPPTSLGHEEHLRAQPAETSGRPRAKVRSFPSGTERLLRRLLIPGPRGGLRLPARSPALDSTGSSRLRA